MATLPEFLEPLAAFQQRVAFANLAGDLLVPYGTAALDARALQRPGVADPLTDWGFQRGTRDTGPGAAPGPRARPWNGPHVFDTRRDGDGGTTALRRGPVEARMADSLNALGWRRVGVRFPSTVAVPLAHQKLVAFQRDRWRRLAVGWIEGTAVGAKVMQRAAEVLLAEPGR